MDELNTNQIWKDSLESIKISVSPAIFSTWFSQTHISEIRKDTNRYIVQIGCNSPFVKTTLENRYYGLVQDALSKVLEMPCDLMFIVKENPNKEKQAEFRKWLTLEVEKIYKEQKKIIEKEAKEIKEKKDKKVRFKKELPLKAKEAIVITPNDEALPVPEEKEPGDDKAELKERLAKIEELEAQKREIIHSNPQATWTPEENNTKETREAREQLEKKDQETEKIFDEVLSLTRIVSPETIKRAEDDAGLSYETTEYEFYSQNKGAVAKKYWGRRGNEGQWEKHSKEEIDACRANLQNILGEDIEEEQAQSFLTLGGYEIETILGARRKKTAKDFFGMGKMFKTPKEKTIIKIAGQEVPLLDFVLNLEGSQKRAIQEIKEITRNKWKNGRRSFRLSLLDKARDLVE